MKLRTFDIETTGRSPYEGAKIFSYCIGNEEGDVSVYRFDEGSSYRKKEILQDFFFDTSVIKIAHNYKFELTFLLAEKYHVPESTRWEDTMLMSRMLRNNAPSHALDYLCWELCGYSRDLDFEVKRASNAYGGFHKVPILLMNKYQVADGQRPMLLYKGWIDDFKSNKKLYKDYRIEIELVQVTQRIEQHGVMVDKNQAEKLISWMEAELENIRNIVYEEFQEYINLNSDAQVARILYKHSELPVLKLTKKGGQAATGKEVLFELREKYPLPIIDLIIKHRSYTTGIGMIKGYLSHCDKKSIIHTTINTNQATTGRESSSNPNLQNVSKEKVLLNPFPVPARRCFRAPSKHILLFGDYSGIEMRLIVGVSGDKKMMKALKRKEDLHRIAATILYGNLFKGEKIKRDAAKNAHFAIPYGASLATVAKSLGISVIKAEPGFENYRKEHPGIAYFSFNIAKEVKELDYVTTPFGRKLYIQEDKAYTGASWLIQGTAAGILKRGQINADRYLKENWNDEVRIILPIHDELVFSYPRSLLKHLKEIVRGITKCMTDIPEINVPLEVEWKMSTTTWDKAKELRT